jgi:hypothetical protein
MLSKIRRLDYLNKSNYIPDKFTDDNKWKNVLTDDFADKAKKISLQEIIIILMFIVVASVLVMFIAPSSFVL